MAYFHKEPKFEHGQQPKIGILLSNLGTPDAPNKKALRKYLQQFLMDRRVVEIPRFIWCWILHCIILVFRPSASAKKYQSIWTKEGSPLKVNLSKQTAALRNIILKTTKQPIVIVYGMSYGSPSIAKAVETLKAEGCTKVLFFPLYPQYASSSTGAGLDALFKKLIKTRNIPEIRIIRNYHDNPNYIKSLKETVLQFWKKNGKPQKLVISFHGTPVKSLYDGDPYHCECLKTGRLLAESLKLKDSEYIICFQSRFGNAKWLQPYFANTIAQLAKDKIENVNVICPGFSSDCLETLEEINIEGKNIFIENGGKKYSYIPALNDNKLWIETMWNLCQDHLQGWLIKNYNVKTEKNNNIKTLIEYKKVKSK